MATLMFSVSQIAAARQALRLQQYTSTQPYGEYVGIPCLTGDKMPAYKVSGAFCPESFAECSSLVPNLSQSAAEQNVASPSFITQGSSLPEATRNRQYKATISFRVSPALASDIPPTAKVWFQGDDSGSISAPQQHDDEGHYTAEITALPKSAGDSFPIQVVAAWENYERKKVFTVKYA